MSNKHIIGKVLCVLAGIFPACSESGGDGKYGPPDGAVYSENFIQVYIEPGTVRLYADPVQENYIRMVFDGGHVSNDSDADKNKYAEYSTRYKDADYNGKLVPNTNISLAEPLSAMVVTCDKAVGDEYPAGSPLNDFIKICATSPKEFIGSRYTAEGPPMPGGFENLSLNKSHGNFPVFKPLSELTSDDLTLLNQTCYLFMPTPLPAGAYNFTVEVTTATSVRMSARVRVIVD